MNPVRIKFFSIILLFSYLLAACGAAGTNPTVEVKASGDGQSVSVEFAGQVDAISADSWSIGGKVVKVDASTLFDGTFAPGDQVKVNATVHADGSVVANRVEVFDPAQATAEVVQALPTSTPAFTSTAEVVISSTLEPGASSTPEAGLTSMTQEFTGIVDFLGGDTLKLSGMTFIITSSTEFKNTIRVGDTVKIHAVQNPDGSITATEIELVEAGTMAGLNTPAPTDDHGGLNSGGDDNGGDDNGGDDNGGDDNGGDDNGGDDNGGDDNGGDDNGGDDNGGDDNGND